MLLHNIPKEVVQLRPTEFAYTGTGKPCTCGEILPDSMMEPYWTHIDDHIMESFNTTLDNIWYCEHIQCSYGSHMYVEWDYGSRGHQLLGVEYACQPCIRGDCLR